MTFGATCIYLIKDRESYSNLSFTVVDQTVSCYGANKHNQGYNLPELILDPMFSANPTSHPIYRLKKRLLRRFKQS